MQSHHRISRRHLLSIVAVAGLFAGGCSGEPGASSAAPAVASDRQSASAETENGHGHAHRSVEATAAMAVDIDVTPDAKAGANLHLTTTAFRWAPEHASGEHVDGEGHAHVYVDGEKLGRLYGEWMHLDLDAGTYDIRVTLNSNDHRDYLVDGDAVDASAQVTLDPPANPTRGASAIAPDVLAADLCDLGERARRDPDGAAALFTTQLHGPLHDVIDVLISSDRGQAGEVMETKTTVEQLAAEPTDGDELADALVGLARELPGGDACGR